VTKEPTRRVLTPFPPDWSSPGRHENNRDLVVVSAVAASSGSAPTTTTRPLCGASLPPASRRVGGSDVVEVEQEKGDDWFDTEMKFSHATCGCR